MPASERVYGRTHALRHNPDLFDPTSVPWPPYRERAGLAGAGTPYTFYAERSVPYDS